MNHMYQRVVRQFTARIYQPFGENTRIKFDLSGNRSVTKSNLTRFVLRFFSFSVQHPVLAMYVIVRVQFVRINNARAVVTKQQQHLATGPCKL